MAKPIPDRYHTITPLLVVKNAADAIKFYKRAFDAEEQLRTPGPGGSIVHAEIKIGDSIVMLADENLELGNRGPKTIGGSPTELMLYTEDVDGAFKQSVDEGAIAQIEPADMFWGDRYGRVEDPFGHIWAMATHKEDLSPEEIARRQEVFFKNLVDD